MVTIGQKIYNAIILVLYHFLVANTPQSFNVHPDEGLNIKTQASKYGYQLDEHHVETPDGYILTLFRLHGKSSSSQTISNVTKPPVLIIHGILSSSHDFVALGPNKSLGYLLADNGYDVWLGNCRGNTWSRKHNKYHPDDSHFWHFSWHEIGYYDIPTKIDFVRNKTGFESIYYIAHSQGTTATFVTASERPEYIKKIRLFIALAPVAFTADMPALFPQLFSVFYNFLELFVYTFGYQELLPNWKLQSDTFKMSCRPGMPFVPICHSIINTNMGYSEDIDPEMIPMIFNNFPAGASTRQVLHFIQNKNTDLFRKYDHGAYHNMRIYGQIEPPNYNLETNMPTALIYTDNDWLSTIKNVDRISAKLKNLKFKYKTEQRFSHADYLFGREMPKVLLPVITKLFQSN